MIKSMTGYGKGEFSNDFYSVKIEIKSVNHRYSDFIVKMPRHIGYFEEQVKKLVKEKISRGKIDIYIYLEYINDSAIDIKVDIPLAKSYKMALENLSKELGMEDNIRIHNIIGMSEIIKTEKRDLDEELLWDCLKSATNIALGDILEMKLVEGKAIKDDMLSKIDEINLTLEEIEKRTPEIVFEHREKLKERIRMLLDKDANIDEDRLEFEIAVFADKSDVNEEIVRLKSHIEQFNSIINEEAYVGRKLDFLIQEMNREINTIGSKANDSSVSQNVVKIKSEIEKIREQVQNIE